MEIRDPVHGSLFYSDQEVAVLDTPVYQRLRAIKQLGFSEFSFPGATHNRYIHSIGVAHLAGLIFDSVFKAIPFSKSSTKIRLRQCTRLAALLHDVGHGPLSHTTEQVMPAVEDLNVKVYQGKIKNRRANHEDYTILFVTEGIIAQTIQVQFPDLSPIHVACLIDKELSCPDDFFIDNGIDYRPLLSQLVSSELDADRMDYLERDSYFCGTNYGKVDLGWLIQNITLHIQDQKAYMALNRRALYSFDDFLISRHHMHLMVYFHHKSIIYEEMLNRYLTSADCSFILPAKADEYVKYNDYKLHEHLSSVNNTWAQRISQRKPFKVLLEMHHTSDSSHPELVHKKLNIEGIESIWASSKARLSKYHATTEGSSKPIFIVDQLNHLEKTTPIDQSTDIFHKYEGARIIDRIYVDPKDYELAKKIIL